MGLVKGPLTLKWGNNTLTGVEEVSLEIEVEESDFTTVHGQKFKVQNAISGSVELTLLDTDIASLKTVLPQYFVAQGKPLSNKVQVKSAEGAIDFNLASCGQTAEGVTDTVGDLTITHCDESLTKLINARSSIAGIEYSDNVRKVTVRFDAEPAQGVAPVQLLNKEDTTA